jgi:hypothetical protein
MKEGTLKEGEKVRRTGQVSKPQEELSRAWLRESMMER